MSTELHQNIVDDNPYDGVDGVDAALIETLWNELDRLLSRERVLCVANEVALGFQNASVKTFLKIFIHRRALERLRQEINEMTSPGGRLQDEQQ